MVLAPSDVPVVSTLTGRALARNATQVRPRVGGSITAILYTPGSFLRAGEPLFAIDPLTYQIAVSAAEADLSRANADLSAAETAFARAERLRALDTASAASFDDARAARDRALAAVASAEAALRLARAELDWTTLRAPQDGIAGLPQVALGDLVAPGQAAPLVEIVQTDPVWIDLTEPYATRLRLAARAASGEITLAPPRLTLVTPDGRQIETGARLVSSGATVSATTGARVMRFEMDNPQGLIAPGMFLHARLELGQQRAILVPQRATSRERDGTLTAWVAVEGKAEKRRLTETGSHGSAWIVTKGVADGDWLLLDGITGLRDGAAVDPTPAVIDAEGVVRDEPPAPAGN